MPSRFKAFPKHLQNTTNIRKSPKKRNLADIYEETSTAESETPSAKMVCLDHNYFLKDSPRKVKRVISKEIVILRKN